MPKIALCCFATGRYQEFLPALAASARLHFHVGQQVTLVALTDGDGVPEGFDHHYPVPHLRWPYGTLYRYRWLAERAKELQDQDYVFMCDADMRFVGPV